MLVNLEAPVINIETNNQFVDERGEPITVGSVLRLAVNNEDKQEKKESAYELLKRIVNTEDPRAFTIKSEEITYLKNQIRKIFVVPIAGWVCDYLEGVSPKPIKD